jgi:hypothetical protein
MRNALLASEVEVVAINELSLLTFSVFLLKVFIRCSPFISLEYMVSDRTLSLGVQS